MHANRYVSQAIRWAATGVVATVLLFAVGGTGLTAREGQPAQVDWQYARQLLGRSQRGEALTPEEGAYLAREKAERQRMRTGAQLGGGGTPTGGKDAIGLTPLSDLAGGVKYKGVEGGLYGGGRNEPPPAQLKSALAEAGRIEPLDAQGKPSAEGRVVLLSIGMSNTTQEFSAFKRLTDADPEKSSRVVIVDGAQGSKDAAAWNPASGATAAAVWAEVDRRLGVAGVTPRQVQAVWLKQALAGPGRVGEYPAHAEKLRKDMAAILCTAKARCPNLRLAYLSSRTYAGYAASQLNPEPFAYEGALAVRALIDAQVQGDPSLNSDPERGEVKAPVLLWGPYLWADGVKGRKAGDLVWKREDFGPDGTHPSGTGRRKVADLLLRFLKTDATARGWFLRRPDEKPVAAAPAQGSQTR